jgi:hypothetical protein
MSNPRYRTVNDTRILVEPTGTHTVSVWPEGQQPHRETFYSLSHMGRWWTVTRYIANSIGIAYGGVRVGGAPTKGEAIALAVEDYGQEVAA